MLFHLSRYYISEVLRVFLLTTAVLTTVIAFGAAIKPLAQDDLFSAGQIMRYVFAAMVPMLQYAMPVAAAFAVTLVIHRMASDNEIIAAAVSGISYRRLLRPIAAFALLLVVVMSGFSHYITPKFLRLLERMITHDITLLFQTALQRDQAFQVGSLQIYSDKLDIIEHPAQSDADTRMVLHRMAAVETDSQGRVKTDVTARQAVIDVFQREDQTYLKMLFVDLVGYKSHTGEVIVTPDLAPDRALVVPNAFHDSLDTRTTVEMHQILASPETYGPISRAKEQLVDALRDHELERAIREALRSRGELRFRSGADEYVVRAQAFAGGAFGVRAGEKIDVTQYRNGQALYEFRCDRATVRRAQSALAEHPSLELTLTEYEVVDLASGMRNARESRALPDLTLEGYVPEPASEQSVDGLLAEARAIIAAQPHGATDAPAVHAAIESLTQSLSKLSADVAGRTMQRIALAFVVLLYALAGMILSMLMRHAPPLSIYTIVFVPSILCLMLIFGGTEVMRDGQLVTGTIIMWTGHGVMAVMCIEGLRRLLRN